MSIGYIAWRDLAISALLTIAGWAVGIDNASMLWEHIDRVAYQAENLLHFYACNCAR